MKILGITIGGKKQSTLERAVEKKVHADIQDHAKAVIEGKDETSKLIHEQKGKATDDYLAMSHQARIVIKEARKLSKMIDTATAIAIATKS
jgi:hypothetical protein